ncbi:MAG: hypothetical protein CVV28_11940 [Methanobacteriales archaeon HGW-Methanobacteriales-1]|jgi:uncharacterized membrane protein|nr:MAG: hypothetical protein CVV28_11940 [Methanobacteriales archaeon HGW-Methanobacteriales-1]
MSGKDQRDFGRDSGPLKIYSVPLCHGIPDRTIYFKNKPLPLCARCTGTLIGIFTLPIFHWVIISPSLVVILVLGLPALLDGITQFVGWRESNNKLRLITGFLLGMSIACLIVIAGQFLVKLILNS